MSTNFWSRCLHCVRFPWFGRRPRPVRSPSARLRLALEELEVRQVPSTITVQTFADGASTARAAWISPNVAPNLRSAVDKSSAGDTIALTNGTYLLTAAFGGELQVAHNLTIINAANGLSIIDAQMQSRVFEIDADVGATMSGLEITHGNGTGNVSSGVGGGILMDPAAQLNLNNDIVTNNAAYGGGAAQGGGIFTDAGSLLNATNSTISHNAAYGGGGFASVAYGGGIDNYGGTVNLTNCTVASNEALGGTYLGTGFTGYGGGLATFGFGAATAGVNITASTFDSNVAKGGGATGEFAGNGNAYGGGVFEGGSSSPVNIARSTFSNNQAVGGTSGGESFGAYGGNAYGGGLAQKAGAGTLTIFNSTFGNNIAQGSAAGAEGFAGNANGGGLMLEAATGSSDFLVNDTIARNSAQGGIDTSQSGTPGNATGGGVDLLGDGTTARFWNTIIALNAVSAGTGGTAADPDFSGTVTDLGHNLVGNTTGSTGFSAANGDLLNVTAAQIALDPLANNGGPTQTMRLEPSSIAIDHADDAVLGFLSTDQRGFQRRSGPHVDIGAYERLTLRPLYHVRSDQLLAMNAANGVIGGGVITPPGTTVRLVPGTLTSGTFLAFNSDGSFVYRPVITFNGTVTFMFQVISNGVVVDTFTGTIIVTRVSRGRRNGPV
jgi:hypothetical protein